MLGSLGCLCRGGFRGCVCCSGVGEFLVECYLFSLEEACCFSYGGREWGSGVVAARGAWGSWQRLVAPRYEECCLHSVGVVPGSILYVGVFVAQLYIRYVFAYRRVSVR